MNGTNLRMQRVAMWLMTALKRQDQIDAQLVYISCLLLLFIWGTVTGRASTHDQILVLLLTAILVLEPVERTPAAVATCQVSP